MKLLSLINCMFGAWLAGEMVVIFLRLSQGGSWYEPDRGIATAELIMAIVFAVWFAWQIPVWFWKAVRK